MKYLPFSPFISLITIIIKMGGIPFRFLPRLLPWLTKTLLLEPFRLMELLVYEKKIRKHKLSHDPIFILGHYRSGTTFLYRMFMQSKQLGYMTLLQSVAPEFMLLLERYLTPILDLIARLFKMKNYFHRIPLFWNFPGEDDVGMTAFVTPLGSQWGIMFPEKFNVHFEKTVLHSTATNSETSKWIDQYEYLVKKISIAAKGKQLVLKSPPNTARIRVLLKIFPNAKFVYIHRDPLEVYGSSSQFWDTIINHYSLGKTGKFDKHETILWQYEKMIAAYLDQKNLIPEGNLTEVAYQSLIREPVATIAHIYHALNIGEFDVNKNTIQEFVHSQSSYKKLKHKDTPHAYMIMNRWHRFFRQWGYFTPQTNSDEQGVTGNLSEIY